MPATRKEELAYLAGIIDGEGTISLSHRTQIRSIKAYRQARILLTIYNTHLPLLLWIKERFGGSVHVLQPRNTGWKMSGSIHFGQAASSRILQDVLEFLIVKKAQAEIAIAFQRTRLSPSSARKSGVPQHVAKLREEMASKLKVLNRRGQEYASGN